MTAAKITFREGKPKAVWVKSWSGFAELLALGILGCQMFAIARMPLVEDRFFNWAPHDSRTDYSITATHAGQTVTDADILKRYHFSPVEWHSAGNLKKVIDVAERRKAVQDQWSVRLLYRVNFGPHQVWEYNATVKAE